MYDITPILKGWDYFPNEVTVRLIAGEDHQQKIQMRLDLGLLQMNCDGRPDGKRPNGYESLYEYYQHLLEEHIEQYDDADGFFLDPDDCEELRREAEQYYYRYLSFFHIHDYKKVERDTTRNLRVFDFLKTYAEEDDDRYELEQYRPYVTMMLYRAKSHRYLDEGNAGMAIEMIKEAIQKIYDFYDEMGRSKLAENCSEVIFLSRFLDELLEDYPPDPLESLRKKMNEAVDDEDYEEAAKLRDEIHKLEKN